MKKIRPQVKEAHRIFANLTYQALLTRCNE